MDLPWSWGSKISEQLIRDGLKSVSQLFTGRVLDLGCGAMPYRRILGGNVESWIGIDHEHGALAPSGAAILGSVLAMPFSAGVFDAVLSTQVLEHVADPGTLLKETHRVLKVGGHLILTAPQTNPLHEEPRDFYRYTNHGLEWLATSCGLEVIGITPLGGAIATVGQMILWHLNWVRRTPFFGSALSNVLNASLSWSALRLDPFTKQYGGGAVKDTLNWLLVARKAS